MLWENLTVDDFKEAVEASGKTCVIPIGCIEKHGHHLPLGTDMAVARKITENAALKEKFVIFPYYPFGQVSEVRHALGTIALTPRLQMELLQEVCDEIARNGFKKIVVANGHGGNNMFLRYFAQTMLHQKKDYCVYIYDLWEVTPDQKTYLDNKYGKVDEYGHADIFETSEIMAIDDSLVKMDRLNKSECHTKNRMKSLTDNRVFSGIWWYGDYPNHIAGDPSGANTEYGNELLSFCADNFAKAVKAIKEDSEALALLNEFYNKSDSPCV